MKTSQWVLISCAAMVALCPYVCHSAAAADDCCNAVSDQAPTDCCPNEPLGSAPARWPAVPAAPSGPDVPCTCLCSVSVPIGTPLDAVPLTPAPPASPSDFRPEAVAAVQWRAAARVERGRYVRPVDEGVRLLI